VWKTTEGSTGRLIQLCLAYFALYVLYGVLTKYFEDHGIRGVEYLVYTTIGGSALVFPIVIGLRWYRMKSNRRVEWAGVSWPSELAYIIPSGVCTAVVIPTTTLMYTLPITVMVAMTIMRGSIIVISRVVDEIQIRQGILRKQVYWQENVAVLFAIGGVSAKLFEGGGKGQFDFFGDAAAMAILGSYVVAYAVRIYLMNYFKNTRAQGVSLDNKGFFALEQFAATGSLILGVTALWWLGGDAGPVAAMRGALRDPLPDWGWAVVAGTTFGGAAFFSVFLFMFKGRTATFAGLVNRLTSLLAGTAATLVSWALLGGKSPKQGDWIALGFILVAVAFLTSAEKRRAAELARESAG
jgi:hypothetical protein